MTRVLIAVDGSDASVAAATRARTLFGETAEYLCISVAAAPPPTMAGALGYGAVYPFPMTMAPEVVDDAEAGAKHTAEDVASDAGLVDVEAIGEYGDPSQTILDAAEEHHVDVIVVAGSDKGWFSRLVTGSVSDSVVRHSPVPVLVVH